MNPNDRRDQIPTGDTPRQLAPRHIDGFAPRPSTTVPPRPQNVPAVQQPAQLPQVVPQQREEPSKAAHESISGTNKSIEQLLPAPHEPLLGDGSNPKTSAPKKKRSLKKKIFIGIAIVSSVVLATAASAFAYYNSELQPVTNDKAKHIRVTIESGSTPNQIAKLLKDEGVIRSDWAFTVYTYLSHTRGQLKAGSYSFQPSQNVSEIVNHIATGKQDVFNMTFLPGDTLANHKKRLVEAGYSDDEIDKALAATYGSELFSGKPATADLEGYIYGQTYNFDSSATASDVLQRTFDEFEKQAVANKLAEGFKAQGLTMYQGITLASIIQREVSNPEDEKQVAQVFYSRLKAGMNLGSDVTYQYAAKKLGVAPDPSLDSPYNTRKYAGLPPGPISSPGLSALIAAAYPAQGNYLYFLSGDDNKTYFSTTNEGHERNIAAHCQKKCLIN